MSPSLHLSNKTAWSLCHSGLALKLFKCWMRLAEPVFCLASLLPRCFGVIQRSEEVRMLNADRCAHAQVIPTLANTTGQAPCFHHNSSTGLRGMERVKGVPRLQQARHGGQLSHAQVSRALTSRSQCSAASEKGQGCPAELWNWKACGLKWVQKTY